jgi:lipopolysaccharide assembly protein A
MIIFLIVGLLLGATAVIFALQNITTVTVVFFSWQLEGSLAVIIILSMLAGIIVSSLLSLPDMIKKSFQISNLKKHANKLEEKLTDKEIEIAQEKGKLDANNAYIDDMEKNSKV